VNVSRILVDCADAADALGSSANVRVTRSFPNDVRLRTQPNRLRSIVMNLLGNGVEYNRPGGTIEVSCSANGDGLHMTIRDTGKGIAAEDLPHLFEPFYRADKSRKRDPNHLGLGLFLVRSHIEALGGDCRVESTVDVGTTFHIRVAESSASDADKEIGAMEPQEQHA
jgi:two-component system sensor histidine kinase BaeS